MSRMLQGTLRQRKAGPGPNTEEGEFLGDFLPGDTPRHSQKTRVLVDLQLLTSTPPKQLSQFSTRDVEQRLSRQLHCYNVALSLDIKPKSSPSCTTGTNQLPPVLWRQPSVVMNHSEQISGKVPEKSLGAFQNQQLHSFLATHVPTLYLTSQTKCSSPGFFLSDCYLGNGDCIAKTKMPFTSRRASHARVPKTS